VVCQSPRKRLSAIYLCGVVSLTLTQLTGCTRIIPPTITLRVPGEKALLAHPDLPVKAGHVSVGPAEYREYAQALREELKASLAARPERVKPARAAKKTCSLTPALRVNLTAEIIKTTLSNDPGHSILRAEAVFEVEDPNGITLIHSVLTGQDNPLRLGPLLRELTDTFVARLYGHKQSLNVTLARGAGKFDEQGREAAARGDYAAALAFFRQAIDARPHNHGSLFNAGLMCEALGQYPQAQRYYQRATELAAQSPYRLARERVQRIGSESN
jgi:tetratricopeptide (TPR) repeat protein